MSQPQTPSNWTRTQHLGCVPMVVLVGAWVVLEVVGAGGFAYAAVTVGVVLVSVPLYWFISREQRRLLEVAHRHEGRICHCCAHPLPEGLRCTECGRVHTQDEIDAWRGVCDEYPDRWQVSSGAKQHD